MPDEDDVGMLDGGHTVGDSPWPATATTKTRTSRDWSRKRTTPSCSPARGGQAATGGSQWQATIIPDFPVDQSP